MSRLLKYERALEIMLYHGYSYRDCVLQDGCIFVVHCDSYNTIGDWQKIRTIANLKSWILTYLGYYND